MLNTWLTKRMAVRRPQQTVWRCKLNVAVGPTAHTQLFYWLYQPKKAGELCTHYLHGKSGEFTNSLGYASSSSIVNETRVHDIVSKAYSGY